MSQPDDAARPLEPTLTPSAVPPSDGGTLSDRDLPSSGVPGRTLHEQGLSEPTSGSGGRILHLAGYEVLGELGRGGMGVVYRARHLKLKHEVALKMILAGGHAGEHELARFQLEAAAVARLRHPAIVHIHEFGDHDGKPFFSLEFVEGGSLAGKLKEGPLAPREAAALAEKLGRAMQHAHEQGIVHRDLKPANVLLTASGEPKIADFGLAKQMDADDGLSKTGSVMGTPSYMAPEQAEGRIHAIGPASDVYALGAILYECLTGQVPFKGTTLRETLDMVSNREATPPRRLAPGVPRDLETVCLRCLEKDPKKRYASAAALADDLGRFLRGEPVAARPVGSVERAWRWCRRNPTVAGLAATVAASLLLGTVVAAAFAVEANRRADAERDARAQTEKERDAKEEARRTAEENERKATEAADKERQARQAAQKRLGQLARANEILGSVFRDLDPRMTEKEGKPLQAVLGERLDQAATTLDAEAIGDPLTVAQLQETLSTSLANLGYPNRAVSLLEQVYRTRTAHQGPDHPDTLAALRSLALVCKNAGQRARAADLLLSLLDGLRARLGPDHPDTLTAMDYLAQTYHDLGDLDRAVPLAEEALRRRKARLGPDHTDTLASLQNLATIYVTAGKPERAVPLFEEVAEKMKALLGPDHPDTLTVLSNLALAHQEAGRPDRAVPLGEEVLDRRKARLGPDHPDTVKSLSNLACSYQLSGKPDRAVPLFRDALEKLKARLGPDHPDTLTVMGNLAWVYQEDGKQEAAIPLYEDLLHRQRTVLGSDDPNTVLSMHNLAWAYRSTGQPGRAIPLSEEALAKRLSRLGPDHPHTLLTMSNLGLDYRDAGRSERAVPLFEEVLWRRTATLGEDHPDTITATHNLAWGWQGTGRFDQAVSLYEEALAKRRAKLGPDHPHTLLTEGNLASTHEKAGEPARAELLRRDLLARQQTATGPDSAATASALTYLGDNLLRQDKCGEAEPVLREALAIREKKLPEAWQTFHGRSLLGGALLGRKDYAAAEPLLVSGYEGMKRREAKISAAARFRLAEALERLVRLYEETERKEKAEEYRTLLAEAKKAIEKKPNP
jgi:hypothetical protein